MYNIEDLPRAPPTNNNSIFNRFSLFCCCVYFQVVVVLWKIYKILELFIEEVLHRYLIFVIRLNEIFISLDHFFHKNIVGIKVPFAFDPLMAVPNQIIARGYQNLTDFISNLSNSI